MRTTPIAASPNSIPHPRLPPPPELGCAAAGVATDCGAAVAVTVTLTEAALEVPAALAQVSVYVAVPVVDGVTAFEPPAASDPLQLPDAIQLVALIDDQVIVAALPATTEFADVEIVGAPGGTSANAASA
jgi:hypothetical protein